MKIAAFFYEAVPMVNFDLVVQDHRRMIPMSWDMIGFTCAKNIPLLAPHCTKIIEVPERKGSFYDVKSYNDIMVSEELWRQLEEYDRVLYFQADTRILKKGIEEFAKWDWIGAPWGRGVALDIGIETFVGNGGLSIRNPKVMLEIIRNHPHDGKEYEDTYFARHMHKVNARGASLEAARKFAVETQFALGAVGVHKPHEYHGADALAQIYSQYKTPATVKVVYPVPLDNPDVKATFVPVVKRFIRSMREIDPGMPYELLVVFHHGNQQEIDEMKDWFRDLPVQFHRYDGFGYEIGGFQWMVRNIKENTFVVSCTSRVYAWKNGWLKRLYDVRKQYGNGLYGTSVSREIKFHMCVRCYGIDSDTFNRYPHDIVSRALGPHFETGDGCLLEWYKSINLPTRVVYWDSEHDIVNTPDSPCMTTPNIFRSGDQTQLLVKDKHSLIYEQAEWDYKRQLQRAAFGFNL